MALDWLSMLIAAPMVGYAIERMGYEQSFLGVGLAVAMGTGAFYALDRPAGSHLPH